jgi:hypothetical protein
MRFQHRLALQFCEQKAKIDAMPLIGIARLASESELLDSHAFAAQPDEAQHAVAVDDQPLPRMRNRLQVLLCKRGDGTGFLLESRAVVALEPFDGNIAIQTRIAGFVHLSHATRANAREDFVGSEFVACRKRHGDGNKFIVTTDGFTS